jgi:hypothetical protein
MGKIFYKYRSDSEYTEQIFTSGKVFLSTAEGLNDPFECSMQEIGKSWIEEKVREMTGFSPWPRGERAPGGWAVLARSRNSDTGIGSREGNLGLG